MLALRTWKSMSKSGSPTIVGCWRPNGTSTIRARNGGTRDTRAATRSRICWKPTPPGTPVGSNTSTPAIWRWVVGVQVFHGLVGLKTHCKLCLLVRRDPDGVPRQYAHLGTGNYNATTARIYTDLSLLTADPEITKAVHDV